LFDDTWPAGVGRTLLEEIDSTNAEALRRAPALSGPEWILARRQTGGRGRRGRQWITPAGNFAATLVMFPDEPPKEVALLSFVAALGLFDACVAAVGNAEAFSLKWPNDLLLNGGKLAGILLESGGTGKRVSCCCIGIGVNLVSVPEKSEVATGQTSPVSLLGETGSRVTPEKFLDLLAPAYAEWERRFAEHGFDPVRRAWLERAARPEGIVTARTMRGDIAGTFETVDQAGNLVLSTGSGRRAIAAAEVFFRTGGVHASGY